MAEEKKSFFARLREGLTKTRNNIVKGFDSVFSGYSVIDDEFYEELEETMIMGDLGGRATEEILDRLKEQVNDAKEEIEKTMDTINEAFEKLLDDLYQNAAFEASADARVLKTVLAQDGYMKSDFEKQEE